MEKAEFEPRLRQARERLERLQAETKEQADREAQDRELRLVIGQLQEFAEQVKDGLHQAGWSTQREIIRAMVKRIEVDTDTIHVIYRFSPATGNDAGPGSLQDCLGRQ